MKKTILELNEEDLEREIQKISQDSDNVVSSRMWTSKEDAIMMRLKEKRVKEIVIAKLLNRPLSAISNRYYRLRAGEK